MRLARFAAFVFLLQGVTPALFLGVWRSGGGIILFCALIYALTAWGLWMARRWALPLAFVLTLPQAIIVSSHLFTWRFLVGISLGFGLAPAPTLGETPIFGFRTVGTRLEWAILKPSAPLLTEFASVHSGSFLLVNVIVVPLLALLLALAFRGRSSSATHPAVYPAL